MLVLPVFRVAVFGFWVSLLLAPKNCYGDNETVEVVGSVECADCVKHNIKTSQAFSGLGVTINCMSEKGKLKTRGGSEIDEQGKFRATLPNYKIAKNGELKMDCFAQLHSASGAPCEINNNQGDSKIVFKTNENGKQVFGLTKNLKFYPITCTSALLWPFFKYPPLIHLPNWTFNYPPPQSQAPPPPPLPQLPPPVAVYINTPPIPAPVYNNPIPPRPPPPVPVYGNPSPPPVQVYNPLAPPPSPVHTNPLPTPTPVYNLVPPPVAVPPPIEPIPPPTPVYRNPLPSPLPAYKKPIPLSPYVQIFPPPNPVYPQFLPPPSPLFKKPFPPPPAPISKNPLPPLAPTYQKQFPSPPPTSEQPGLPPPVPVYTKPLQPPTHKSNPHIPKAPPIPELPPIPMTPRKFFNQPIVGHKSSLPPSPSHA